MVLKSVFIAVLLALVIDCHAQQAEENEYIKVSQNWNCAA